GRGSRSPRPAARSRTGRRRRSRARSRGTRRRAGAGRGRGGGATSPRWYDTARVPERTAPPAAAHAGPAERASAAMPPRRLRGRPAAGMLRRPPALPRETMRPRPIAHRYRLVDDAPHEDSFAAALAAGLAEAPRAIPCRFLYDETGSKLFEEICEL